MTKFRFSTPFRPLLVGTILTVIILISNVLPRPTVSASGTENNPSSAVSQSTTLTFNPVADSYVVQTSAGANYGTNTSLHIDSSPITRSYLRFTVKGLNGSPVQSAKLRLFANSSSSTGYTVAALANNTWTETGITYSNAPAPGSALKTSGAITKGQWVETDITSYIKADGTYNLALTTGNATKVNFASRHAANPPKLVVVAGTTAPTATKVPPTATKAAPTATKAAPTATNVPPTATPSGTNYQPAFPIRAAFYYPWFPEAWTQQGIYPYTNYTPKLGYYSSADSTILKKHLDMMAYGNIQAGIASWWGQGSHTDVKIPGLLAAAAGTKFRWALYYENESQGDPSATQIKSDLTYIRDNYAKDPSFLRVNGKFVVFVYASPADGCGMTDRWKQGNTVGAYVVLKVFPGFASCASQPDSWHQYSPAVAADQQGSMSYSISPGFWLKGNPVRLARDINRWGQNVKDMVASKANWQLVTTFSEWGEGTIVEPATQWPSASGYGQYLDALHYNGPAPAALTLPGSPSASTNSQNQASTTTIRFTAGQAAAPTSEMQPNLDAQTTTSSTLYLAGDICKHNQGSADYTANCKKTGDQLRSLLAANPGAQVQTLGDNVNNDPTGSFDAEYKDLYAPNWGSFLNVTHTLMGNHDTYPPSSVTPYYSYFGSTAGGKPGYYTYTIGSNWRVIVLNAQCGLAGGCSATSAQTTWLKNTLAANTKKCVMAVWHQPRWTSGRHADNSTYAPWWNLLYQYKADIVVNGHNHNYERFNLINPSEQAAADGIREFIVGTGGAPGDAFSYASHPLDKNEAVRNQTQVYGVLRLTLNDSSYNWKFLPVSGYSFTDAGSQSCH